MRFISFAIISETSELKAASSGWSESSPAASPAAAASDASPIIRSSFCNSIVHMTSCVKSWKRLETRPWSSSILSTMGPVCAGKTCTSLSTNSLGLNSSHLSGCTPGPRKSTKVGVPRATGHPSGKSFFSMLSRLNTIGALLLLRSSAKEFTNGLMRKHRKQVSSYICSSTGGPRPLASRTSWGNDLPETRGTSSCFAEGGSSSESRAKKSTASWTGTSSPTLRKPFRWPLYMTTRIGFLPPASCPEAPLASGTGGSPSFLTLW
mmetsp:Transcript_69422/g.206825  ORF Transcript_69422/g.206825 Transcript_69422/m.206825 type:complete len:264 (-) Transcript_69422:701-1492(-)